MGWRESIAKVLAGKAERAGLPTPAYHGTTREFTGFVNNPSPGTSVDRALGTHLAKDPALSNSFAMKYLNGPTDVAKEGGRVIPAMIPHESKLLEVPQPRYDWAKPDTPAWQAAQTDTRAVEIMAAKEAYRRDPALLARYISESRNVPLDEAARHADAMVGGKSATIQGRDYDLPRFLDNYGGQPYNDADRVLLADTARKAWQGQGYAGLKYVNTAPMEMAFGAKDPTSYIVFDPSHIRSRFAEFDPAKAGSSDLLAGVAGAAVALPTLGAFTRQDTYKEDR